MPDEFQEQSTEPDSDTPQTPPVWEATALQTPVVENAPSVAPLACRCGSTVFGVPQTVTFALMGEALVATPAPVPDTVPYTCMGCGETGTLAYLKGRLNG